MANRKSTPVQSRRGSALLLVLVVTVLLSVIGILFVMVTRLREVTSSNVADSRDLDGGIEAVVGQINKTLKNDVIAAINGTELYDSTSSDDSWLASLEPNLYDPKIAGDPTDDFYKWGQITKFPGVTSKWDLILRDGAKTSLDPNDVARLPTDWDITKKQFGGIVEDYQQFWVTDAAGKKNLMTSAQIEGLPADADGDGVADSIWMKLPNLSSSRGQPIFAAVRIIDNCAMLNLNTAFGFFQRTADARPWHSKPWFKTLAEMTANVNPYNSAGFGVDLGRYLSEVNFGPLLRAYDAANGGRVERIQLARDTEARKMPIVYNSEPNDYHDKFIMSIDDPNDPNARLFQKFDISDELEMRNRYMLTSKTISRIERRDTREQLDQGLLPRFLQGLFGEAYDGIGYQTFDFEQGRDIASSIDNWSPYFEVRVASTPFSQSDFGQWKKKLNPLLFDNYPYPNPPAQTPYCEYDRRHVCTFYSFDRNLRSGSYVLIDAAMKTPAIKALSETQRKAIDAIFRPKDNRPINLRWITDPANPDNIARNTLEARRNILHLLYAFMEYYCDPGLSTIPPSKVFTVLSPAAKKSAQIVANMIDYLDDNNSATQGPFYNGSFAAANGTPLDYQAQQNQNPTFINRAIIRDMIREVSIAENQIDPAIPIIDIGATIKTPLDPFEFGLGYNDTATPPFETVYGYEQQPFISELYVRIADDTGAAERFAIELVNPYDGTVDVSGWRLVIEDANGNTLESLAPLPASTSMATGSIQNPSRLVLRSDLDIPYDSSDCNSVSINLFSQLKDANAHRLCLQRIDPITSSAVITVDQFYLTDIRPLLTDAAGDGFPTHHIFKRQDNSWKVCDPNAPVHSGAIAQIAYPPAPAMTLGTANGVVTTAKERQLPVANTVQPIYTLGDFQKILFVGNEHGVSAAKSITDIIADPNTSESDIRFDLIGDLYVGDVGMLGYFCTLNRDEGNLPGRININTAPVHVIAAAIPPQLVITGVPKIDPNYADALTLAENVVAKRPYTSIADLLMKIPVMKKFATGASDVGEQGIRGDFEERDWIFNRLSNIFTVRSDTFTAYILVRLGTDGPQRRMIAIFDRSNVWSDKDKPRLVALHPVPDPR